jgi:GT2 family glycosyltransferase/uncharacterized membrane protein
MINLSIIIVSYNVKEFLQNLLSSIRKAKGNLSLEIIVVDNNSEDGTVESISGKYSDITLITNKKNVGFGKANNQGMKIARGKYFLLINPDTLVKENTLSKMIEFLENTPDAGMAGCKVLNPNGTLQLPCRRSFPGPWVSFTKISGLSQLFPKSKLFARYNLTYLDEDKTYPVDAISGSFMFLRRETYEKTGGFDNDFFMYGEDLDFCYRVKEAGYKIYYYPETEIIHYKGESTKRSSIDETRVFYQAMGLFVEKHFSSSWLVKFLLKVAILFRESLAFANKHKLAIFSVAVDFLMFMILLYAAEQIYTFRPNWNGFHEETKPFIYILPALFQIIVSSLSGVYRSDSLSVSRTILSLFIGLVLISSSTFFLKQYAFSRAVVLITYLLVFLGFTSWRIILKLFFKVGLDSSFTRKRTLIVGTSKSARSLLQKLKSNIQIRDNVLGFISLEMTKIGEKIDGVPILGSIKNIDKVVRDNSVEKVIFTSDEIPFTQIFNIVARQQKENVSFLIAGGELDYIVGKSAVTLLEDISLMKINYNISSGVHRFYKRMFDLAVSIPALMLIYPFVFLLAKAKKSEFFGFVLGIPSVFIGKKSIVGPKESSNENNLYLGKPGLTGYWFTENIDCNDKDEITKLNLFYAKNQNIWLDLDILGKTILKMFNGAE